MIKLNINIPAISAILTILITVLLLGYYSVYLNHLYYASYGPFYDSMAYMNQLAMIMNTSKNDGFVYAIKTSLSGTTVFFPWLEGALLGQFIEPSRQNSIFIQMPLIFIQAISGYVFFRKLPRYTRIVSVVFSIVLISFSAIFFYNGGLSDLRMDLSQSLAFGSSLAFFALARQTNGWLYWVLFGVMLSVAFLVRATTPVYAILVFGLFLVLDLVSSMRQQCYANYLRAITIITILSFWFFLVNFDQLYYYYFVWNYDANASLPISESIGHIDYLFNMHIGIAISFLLLLVISVQIWTFHTNKVSIIKNLNWVPFLGGAIPLFFLVLFGAALNPFVSMVAVPGVLMFALAPMKYSTKIASNKFQTPLYVSAAILALSTTWSSGIPNHTIISSPWTPSQIGISLVIEKITDSIKIHPKNDIAIELSYVGSLDSTTILNSLVYEHGFSLDLHQRAVNKDLSIKALHPGLANPTEWQLIEGRTDEEKLIKLVKDAVTLADYLIVPTDTTTFVPHHPITPYALEFRNMLLESKSFEFVAGPIEVSSLESVTLYRNIK